MGNSVAKTDAAGTNKLYGGLDIKGENIYFVNAGDDPWQYAGMTKIHNPDTQSKMVAMLADCADCGHCIDLHTPDDDKDPQILKNIRADIKVKLAGWLAEHKAKVAAKELEPSMFLQQ